MDWWNDDDDDDDDEESMGWPYDSLDCLLFLLKKKHKISLWALIWTHWKSKEFKL